MEARTLKGLFPAPTGTQSPPPLPATATVTPSIPKAVPLPCLQDIGTDACPKTPGGSVVATKQAELNVVEEMPVLKVVEDAADSRSRTHAQQHAIKLWDKIRENPIAIGPLLLFCFPIGLFLVWKHSSWTNKTKWIWSGAWAGIMLIGFIGSQMERQETAKVLAEANALWDSGKKGDAVNKYHYLLSQYRSSLDNSDRPLVLKRVIEFDADNGNAVEAKTLIQEARQAQCRCHWKLQ